MYNIMTQRTLAASKGDMQDSSEELSRDDNEERLQEAKLAHYSSTRRWVYGENHYEDG
jgi:hypothetical protein